jgi:hypothetical protein
MQPNKTRWADITGQEATTLLQCLLPDLVSIARSQGLASIATKLDQANQEVTNVLDVKSKKQN